MSVSEESKQAALNELQKSEPLMDLAQVREELLKWLEQWPCPGASGNESWENHLRESPATEEEAKLESGLRVRLGLRLQTEMNSYRLSILESLVPASRNVYIVCVHVNWKDTEWQLQKSVEDCYNGSFDDAPKASHTIWAQNFVMGELPQALNACALAILGHELVDEPTPAKRRPDSKLLPVSVNFPKPSDD